VVGQTRAATELGRDLGGSPPAAARFRWIVDQLNHPVWVAGQGRRIP
jgi:hypothetical protein